MIPDGDRFGEIVIEVAVTIVCSTYTLWVVNAEIMPYIKELEAF